MPVEIRPAPPPRVSRHIRVIVSTDIQDADLPTAFFGRGTFCKEAASSSRPRTAPDLPGVV